MSNIDNIVAAETGTDIAGKVADSRGFFSRIKNRIGNYVIRAGLAAATLALYANVANAAMTLTVDNPNPQLNPGYSTNVTATLDNNATPISGEPMTLVKYAKETFNPLGDPAIIDPYDILNPAGISVSMTSPTDLLGHSTITIAAASNAAPGTYHYLACNGTDYNDSDVALTGNFTVMPEPCTVGLLGLGAGLLALRKRGVDKD